MVNIWGPKGNQPCETECNLQEMDKIRKDVVNFHGEMVLLLNYSSVNYTGRPMHSISGQSENPIHLIFFFFKWKLV